MEGLGRASAEVNSSPIPGAEVWDLRTYNMLHCYGRRSATRETCETRITRGVFAQFFEMWISKQGRKGISTHQIADFI
jgi:hypothetical protein